MEAFFFPSSSQAQIFGVWREVSGAKWSWVFCPPFAEEEKSARRTLTEIARFFERRGENSLVFSYRGTGDSQGNFADFALNDWSADVSSAISEARHRSPEAKIALLGLRLGASLAFQHREVVQKLLLIEPLLDGRAFLREQAMKKRLRSQLSKSGTALPAHDLDGWELGEKLRGELENLDLRAAQNARFTGPAFVVGVGPKSEVAPPLGTLAEGLGAKSSAVVMPAFWNLLDLPDAAPLLQKLEDIGV